MLDGIQGVLSLRENRRLQALTSIRYCPDPSVGLEVIAMNDGSVLKIRSLPSDQDHHSESALRP
jgi:hypothetical protein